ncbi:alpha/beta hydrolase [Erysipelothrix larvae]|uniref:Alpha/beta hydrolase n=1 Tax=Erysipelothrix larvae TaxID=1514105 RepID=A0A0X8GYM1_9FIRM|nr:patatin family protein [Erysipelothrix larvae]AMC92639.1 alpha/beta hydrolase [Erysipelothrix larvae]
MAKIGLVLEGGGMRGAYTAGCLAWLIENGYEFDVTIGISSGALYGSMFVLGKKETLHLASTTKAADWRNSGLGAVIFERQVVGYNYMFETIIKDLDYPLEDISKINGEFYAGVYDLELQETVWKNKYEIDAKAQYIKAACTLPVMGRAVKINGKKYMDGGITTMIPVSQSIEHGCDYHLVVSTKSADYVRKPQKGITYKAMNILYRKYPELNRSFQNRTNKYYEERAQIDALIDEGKAINLFPSQEMGVGRFGGTLEQYNALYALAYKDCESRRDAIDTLYQQAKNRMNPLLNS